MRHILIAILFASIACTEPDDPYDPPTPTCPPGSLRCPCYGNGTCDSGLTCASDVCVSLAGDPGGGDPGGQGDSSGGGDGGGGDPGLFGPSFPVGVGTTAWYVFSHTYRRSIDGGTGLSVGEKQSSGHLCLEVTEVQDTETPAYASEPETLVLADVKIVGDVAGDDIVVVDQYATGAADPTTVDASHAALWLKRVMVPSRGHGFTTPAQQSFHTREPPVPPTSGIGYLPFFDPRVSHDWTWGGWDRTNDDCVIHSTEQDCPDTCEWNSAAGACENAAQNYLNQLFSWFIVTYGASFFVDNSLFYERHPFNADCESYADLTACQTAQCSWDFSANGGAGACIVLHRLDVRWRHTVTTGGVELQGPVLHSLHFEYFDDGELRSAEELIAPDPNPGSPSANDLTNFTGCFDSQPCATANVELHDGVWADAYCTF